MATETAPKIENPNTSDLNITPSATEDVPSTEPPSPPGGGEVESDGKAVAEKTKVAEDSGDVQKKMKRAERFGVPVKLSEEEKRNSRAERFGTGSAVNGSDSSKSAEELKRKARGERFGTVQSEPAEEEAKKKARVAKFGSSLQADPVEEEKKKARAIRFSQPDSGSKLNGKENIEAKTAIAGKAGGEET